MLKEVNDQVIDAMVSKTFLLLESANEPVKSTIIAKEVLNTGPDTNEYLLSPKPGMASPML